jgi:hypothetical protein
LGRNLRNADFTLKICALLLPIENVINNERGWLMTLTEQQLEDLIATLEESQRLLSAAAGPFSRNTPPSTYVRVAGKLSEILNVLRQD